MRAFLLPLLLAGCFTDAPQTEEAALVRNEILITRAERDSNGGAPVLFLEAREIGLCTADEPTLIRVPDGTWAITAFTPGGEVTERVTLGGGQQVRLTCGTTGRSDPAPFLVPEVL